MNDKPELKPCPFCGGEPTLDDDTMGHSVVCCYHCYAQAGFGPGDDAAIAKWNTRATPQPDASALVEAAKALCGAIVQDEQGGWRIAGDDPEALACKLHSALTAWEAQHG
jgi:Lar family restriction alleviation protein